jgi:integrase/recombinase XerC
MQTLTKNFLEYLKSVRHSSPHTIRNYELDLFDFKAYLESQALSLDLVDRKVIRQYLAYLSEKNLQKRSIARRVSTLRSFFKFLMKFEGLKDNPLELIDPMKQPQTVPRALTQEEIALFFEQPDQSSYLGFRDRTILELLYSSALRISELVSLSRQDIHFEDRLIEVLGKGNKKRIVPVTENGLNWLKSYLEHPERHLQTSEHDREKDSKAVFLNRFGKRITVRSVDRLFQQYLLSSGLASKVTPHVIRHSIATHWLEKGMNLKMIQELLGHESLSTTQIYTKVSKGYKQEGYAKAHPLMKKERESE